MALMRETDPRFANLERRVGIFLLASVFIVVAVVAVVGVRQGVFTPKTTITFHDDSGRDLAEGMEVVTRGFRIGKVKRVQLDETGRVEVTLAIDKSLFRWVRQDSTARIVAKAFIGDSHIDISPGTPAAPPMPPGGSIDFVRDPDLTDVAKKVMEDVKPVLLAVKSLIEYLDNPQGDVKRTIANVNQLSAGLVETRLHLDETLEQVGARVNGLAANLESLSASLRDQTLPQVTGVIEDAGRTTRSLDAFVRDDLHGITAKLQNQLLPQVHEMIAAADKATVAAGGSLEQVNRELPALLAKVNASLENVRAITENLVPASQEAGSILRQGGELVEDSQALVQRTSELWPFATKKSPGTTVDVDSYETRQTPAPGPAADPRAR